MAKAHKGKTLLGPSVKTEIPPPASGKWRRGIGNRRGNLPDDAVAKARVKERETNVMLLKASGLSYEQIAKAIMNDTGMPLSASQARRDFRNACDSRREDGVAEHRAMCASVLQAVVAGMLGRARAGSARSAAEVTKAIREYASLYGARVDKVELSGPDGAVIHPMILVPPPIDE